jgi:hypothetical protein
MWSFTVNSGVAKLTRVAIYREQRRCKIELCAHLLLTAAFQNWPVWPFTRCRIEITKVGIFAEVPIRNLTEIRPVEDALIQTDWQANTTNITGALRDYANYVNARTMSSCRNCEGVQKAWGNVHHANLYKQRLCVQLHHATVLFHFGKRSRNVKLIPRLTLWRIIFV